MIWLLVIATLAAPIGALLFADWYKQRKRNKDKEFGS